MAVRVGQDVGSYHIIEALGQGGMATVYKAYDTILEREVAIKFIRMGVIGSDHMEQVLKRFGREARALAKFLHPNIVPVYGFGEHEGIPYLVMAYLPGGTVKGLTGKPMPYDQAARLLAPVARALDYAHKQNVIHRDVKPGNILLTTEGIPMLSDFGIAKILGTDDTTQLTSTGVGVGTPEYMAPEQWEGKVAPQTDIYALGVVFYELVTGRKPYTADTPAGVLLKQANNPLPSPRQFVPDLPEEVEHILYKALAKEVGNRYASMGGFAGALERLCIQPSPSMPLPKVEETGETLIRPRERAVEKETPSASIPPAQKAPVIQAPSPQVVQGPAQSAVTPEQTATQVKPAVQAPTATSIQPQRSTSGKITWLWTGIGIMALCLVVLVVAGIATQGFGLGKPSPTMVSSDTPQPTSTPIPTLTSTATLTLTPSSTPTLELPVSAGTLMPLPHTVISIQNVGRLTAFASWNNGIGVQSIVLSPDGKTLASGSWDKKARALDNTIKLWRVSDGSLLFTLTDTTGSVTSIAFSPDGKTLASGSQNHTVKLWQVQDGKLLFTLTGHTDIVISVAFSPDGKTLASGSVDKTVKLWQVSDGSLLSTILGHNDWVGSVAFSPDGKTLASGSYDCIVKLWRVPYDNTFFTLMGHAGTVRSVAFSPDGKTLASGSDDKTIKLWRVSDGSLISTLQNTDSVSSVAFSPDGTLLASGLNDGTVRLWRASDGKLLFIFQGHTDIINSIAFSPDGTLLASGSWDGTIRLWGVP